jgi:hypothetical protein
MSIRARPAANPGCCSGDAVLGEHERGSDGEEQGHRQYQRRVIAVELDFPTHNPALQFLHPLGKEGDAPPWRYVSSVW